MGMWGNGSRWVVARPTDLALDDASLVFAAQAGDPDAFSELFKRHYPQVKRVVARKLGNLRDADEIAQSAFVRAYERIDRCGGDRRFGAWVQVIANNLAVDHLRASNRTRPSEEPVKGDDALGPNAPEDSLLRSEQASLIRRALDTLPERQREVVVARDMEGRRPPEIAAAMGLTLGAVDSILLRARRRLANTVQSMTAETGASSLATTSTLTATGTAAIARSGSLQRMIGAVGELVSRASFQVASSIGMVPGAESVGSQAAQLAAAGLMSLVPAGAAAAVTAPDVAPAITATVEEATQAVAATVPAAPASPDPAAIPTAPPVAPPADPSAEAPAPPAAPAPEPEPVVVDVLGTTVEAVRSVVGDAAKPLRLR
ncbi:MAG TPA: RNA polymerase sigma factor [Acidimicrobiales bacterium]|nr:RNA polymerase sigma factor [Acidimicrobiales bacterium]